MKQRSRSEVVGFLRLLPLVAVILAFPMLWSAAARAQEASRQSPETEAAGVCRVYVEDVGDNSLPELGASCRGRGLMLGRFDHFDVIDNAEMRATLVDARRPGDRRILLLALQEGGEPVVTDMTGAIALAAGRSILSPIDGLEIDFAPFSTTGEIAVHDAREIPAAARFSEAIDGSSRVDVAQELSLQGVRRDP